MRRPRPGLVAAVLVLGGFAAGYGMYPWLGAGDRAPGIPGALPEPRALVPFTLEDHDGRPFTRESLLGRWTFFFFGYTHCPDVCPQTLAALGALQRRLEGGPLAGTGYAFVTVDPERDTRAHLAEYATFFGERIRGVRGADGPLLDLTAQLGVGFERQRPEPGEAAYLVDHTASVMLVNPAAELVATLPGPHDPASLAGALEQLSGVDLD